MIASQVDDTFVVAESTHTTICFQVADQIKWRGKRKKLPNVRNQTRTKKKNLNVEGLRKMFKFDLFRPMLMENSRWSATGDQR